MTRDFIGECGEIWKKAQTHRFVTELSRGTLETSCFQFYLVQDYLFLIAYARMASMLCYKAPDVGTMTAMSELVHSTLKSEMALHRRYAAELEIPMEALASATLTPTTLAYTMFMLETASRESFLAGLVCLLPCAVGYAEIGKRIASEQTPEMANPYSKWIDTYSGSEFREYAEMLEALADNLAAVVPEFEKKHIFDIFLRSTQYEWMFWEMAMNAEKWPV